MQSQKLWCNTGSKLVMAALHFVQDWREELRTFLQTARVPLLVVLGPTASGKTSASIDIAQWLGLELGVTADIVNADSRQCYRHLDIGTAKIRPEHMHGIAHHLFSVLDPKDECTIAWYQREATSMIDAIHKRGNVPMLVGGSMLYISAIIDGLQPIAGDADIRKQLECEYEQDAGQSLHRKLSAIDPQSAASIPRQNKVYLMRAMEIYRSTGRSKTEGLRRVDCPYDTLLLGMYRERKELCAAIDTRTTSMLQSGWIDEVRSLLDKGYTSSDAGLVSHGYREIALAILAGDDPMNLDTVIAAKTRQYAKRQMTWWRGDERIGWIEMSDGKNSF